MTKKLFDPEKAFFQLPIVWWTISLFTVTSAVITLIILFKSELQVDLSYTGFNLWITINKLPLGILALLIPVIAVLATNHRSEQTKETINLTRSQNRFSNYYKHLEEFTKYTDKISNDDIKIDARKLHAHLFPDARVGSYLINKDTLVNTKNNLKIIAALIKSLSNSENDKIAESIAEILKAGAASISKNSVRIYKREPDFSKQSSSKEDATRKQRLYQINQKQSIHTIILRKLDELKKYDEILRFDAEQYVKNDFNELINEATRIASKIPDTTNLNEKNEYVNHVTFPNNESENLETLYKKILAFEF